MQNRGYVSVHVLHRSGKRGRNHSDGLQSCFRRVCERFITPSMSIDVGSSIVIVDEAHNLPDRIKMGLEMSLHQKL